MKRSVALSADAVAVGRTLSSPQLSPDAKRVCYGSSESGRTILLVNSLEDGIERAAAPVTLRSGYFGFAGRYRWSPDGTMIYLVDHSGDLVVVDIESGCLRSLFRGGAVSDLEPSPDGDGVLFVVDQSAILYKSCMSPDDPPVLVADISTERADFRAPDFLASPRYSPDGQWIAWAEWSHPDMPWDGSRIVLLRTHGSALKPEVIFGSPAGEFSATQPRYDPDSGDLYALSDRTGFTIPWLVKSSGSEEPKPVFEFELDCAEPDFSPGQSSYCVTPNGLVVAVNRAGFGTLSRIDQENGLVDLKRGVFGGLDSIGGVGVALRSGARTPTQIVTFETSTERVKALAAGPPLWIATDTSVEPEVVSIRFDQREFLAEAMAVPFDSLPDDADVELSARLYVPTGTEAIGVICWLHGGPTGQTRVTSNPRFEFFLDRGYAIVVPDYRGSSGSGRSKLRAIYGHFGVSDVIDSAAALRWSHRHLAMDPVSSFILGTSSAGGTVMGVLRHFPGLVGGGVAAYPVTDILGLVRSTWRFEERYFDDLIGPLPEFEDRYLSRSPMSWAREIDKPLLVFQGLEDEVVPAALTDAFVAQVGDACEYVRYPGQGHGWSGGWFVKDELERIESFLGGLLGITDQ